jgi:transcription initiation factor IIE alpha subunit
MSLKTLSPKKILQIRQNTILKDLIKLEELGYIDLWKLYSNEDSDIYTWHYPTRTELEKIMPLFPQSLLQP